MSHHEMGSLPRFVRGRLPWFLLGMTALVGVILYLTLLAPLSPWPNWFRVAGWTLYAICLPLLIIWFVTPMPKARARVRRGELPCWHCGYNVRGVDQPRCPECGHDFNAQELQAKWNEAITRAAHNRR